MVEDLSTGRQGGNVMKRTIVVAVVCAVIAASALADMTDPATALTINNSLGGYNGGAYVGGYDLNIMTPSGGYTGPLGDVESFCIDTWDSSASGYTLYKAVSLDAAPDPGAGPMGTTRARQLAQLLNTYWVTNMSPLDKTALQAAVWEVVDEGHGSLDAGSGTFYVSSYGGNDSSAIITRANQMLGSITTGASFDNYLALSSPAIQGGTQYQDYVVKTPVPAAVLLGLLGLATAGVKLRKFV
jgi:hypothetical protein